MRTLSLTIAFLAFLIAGWYAVGTWQLIPDPLPPLSQETGDPGLVAHRRTAILDEQSQKMYRRYCEAIGFLALGGFFACVAIALTPRGGRPPSP